MAMQDIVEMTKASDRHDSLAETVKEMEEKCRTCKPSSVLDCVSQCRTWRLKNEFRHLNQKMKTSDYLERLLNTLKNRRRLQILDATASGRFSADRLRQELKRLGFTHSRKTIEEEYIQPLLQIGLAEEEYGKYHATAFGCRVSELVKGLEDVEEVLPPRSECYEETALLALLSSLRTCEDFRRLVPEKSATRVLGRLQKAALVETSKDRDYVFFFRTQRDPAKEKLSATEKRTYENIPGEGVSARRLADRTGISLRRTYKYLRHLKGKKLVFTRKKPRVYKLTARGAQIAGMIQGIHKLVTETLATAAELEREQKTYEPEIASISQTAKGDKEKTMANPPMQYAG